MTEALSKLGYAVTAADVNVEDYRASSAIEYRRVDFNDVKDLSGFVDQNLARFDVALGVEVIEHVENPWFYVRSLVQLARPGGLVVVSTPNTASWHSRLRFLRSGEFDDFGLNGQSGHINPISPWELEMIVGGAGVGNPHLVPIGDIYSAPTKLQRLIRGGTRILRPLQSGVLDGMCVVVYGRRSN